MPKGFETSNNLPDECNDYETTDQRRADKAFYSSARWRKLRLMMLRRHPLCSDCRMVAASEVHHIIDRKERPDLAFDMDNLTCLCKPCHSTRTASKPR